MPNDGERYFIRIAIGLQPFDADVFLLLPDTDEFPQENNRI